MPFVSLGAVPEAASSLLLPQLVGYQRAAELLLLGRPFDAARAREMGLVNEIVAEDRLLEHARAAAAALAAQPPGALRLARGLLKRTQAQAVAARVTEEMQLFSDCLKSPEAKEAMGAFLEKRKPDFSRFEPR
jgi:enoyl-CoA hydratase/carnithine racemase